MTTENTGNSSRIQGSHFPAQPRATSQSVLVAMLRFIPLTVIYLLRHLTIGSGIRLRRFIFRRLGRSYYV
jgi:hypothetical protein